MEHKEISLKKPAQKTGKEATPEMSKESYPSFTIYDDVPDELMNLPMGKEIMAKIKKAAEEKRLGKDARKSVGFDVISVMMHTIEEHKEETPKKKEVHQGKQSYME